MVSLALLLLQSIVPSTIQLCGCVLISRIFSIRPDRYQGTGINALLVGSNARNDSYGAKIAL